jgi:CheY-specific phosphatase CheX
MSVGEPVAMDSTIQASIEVLETMFFELPAGLPEETGAPSPEGLCATVRFSGTSEGSLSVALEPPVLRRLSAAFLGIEEEEVTERLSLNVLCEMANMICGASQSRIHPGGRIAIETPQVMPVTEVLPRSWIRFPLERGSLAISLTYKGH